MHRFHRAGLQRVSWRLGNSRGLCRPRLRSDPTVEPGGAVLERALSLGGGLSGPTPHVCPGPETVLLAPVCLQEALCFSECFTHRPPWTISASLKESFLLRELRPHLVDGVKIRIERINNVKTPIKLKPVYRFNAVSVKIPKVFFPDMEQTVKDLK